MECVNVSDEVRGRCHFYNQTGEGYLPEIDRNKIIFSFSTTLHTSCSRLVFCSSLLPLCLPSGVVLPCHDVCFSIYTSCHHIFLLHGFQWPDYLDCNRGIHADVIVYIFAQLHTTLRTEGNMLDTN